MAETNDQKKYILVNKSKIPLSGVVNDCSDLCVPATKGEPLSSILNKICEKVGSQGSGVAGTSGTSGTSGQSGTSGVGKCRGCFNRHKLESQDWWWCPDHKGTPRQFECSRFISSSRVIDSLKQIIN